MQIDWHKVADALREEAEKRIKEPSSIYPTGIISAKVLNSLSVSIRAGIVKDVPPKSKPTS